MPLEMFIHIVPALRAFVMQSFKGCRAVTVHFTCTTAVTGKEGEAKNRLKWISKMEIMISFPKEQQMHILG